MPKVELSHQSWGTKVLYHCPGCKGGHAIDVRNDGGGPSWEFNGDVESPTISPSVLVRSSKFTAKGEAEMEEWRAAGCPHRDDLQFDYVDTVCHSFINAGQIQFLSDSTHHLAGQTVELPEID